MKIAFENINERMSCDEFLANLAYLEMIIRQNYSICLDISKKYIIRFLTEVTGNVFRLKMNIFEVIEATRWRSMCLKWGISVQFFS